MKAMSQIVLGFIMVISAHVQAQLPEFTELVDEVSPAVVNISTRPATQRRHKDHPLVCCKI